MTPGAFSDQVQYGLDDQPGYTDRLAPMWWSGDRLPKLQEHFEKYLSHISCPITMGVRAKACQEPAVWFVRKVAEGYRLEQPGNDFHLTIIDEGLGDELTTNLARWAAEGTPLSLEVTHGP